MTSWRDYIGALAVLTILGCGAYQSPVLFDYDISVMQGEVTMISVWLIARDK